MFEGKNIVNVFPCPIWVHRLKPEPAERINGKALDLIESIRAATPNIEPGEAWQTPHDLQDRAELGDLMDCVKAATRGVLDLLRVQHDSFVITGCWANIKPKGSQRHPMHTHANNYLSGVYYAQVPDTADGLAFHEPRVQALVLSPKVKKQRFFRHGAY